MKELFTTSLKIVLLNFSATIIFISLTYFLDKYEVKIKGLGLFFVFVKIIIFVISVKQIGKVYVYRIAYLIILTSLSIIFISFSELLFSLFLYGYIDPNLRFEIAHASATHFYENIKRLEQEQNVTFLFNYDDEVNRIVKSFEPADMFYNKAISTLIIVVIYNFLVLLSNRGNSE